MEPIDLTRSWDDYPSWSTSSDAESSRVNRRVSGPDVIGSFTRIAGAGDP